MGIRSSEGQRLGRHVSSVTWQPQQVGALSPACVSELKEFSGVKAIVVSGVSACERVCVYTSRDLSCQSCICRGDKSCGLMLAVKGSRTSEE